MNKITYDYVRMGVLIALNLGCTEKKDPVQFLRIDGNFHEHIYIANKNGIYIYIYYNPHSPTISNLCLKIRKLLSKWQWSNH